MFNWMVAIQEASSGVVDLFGKRFLTQSKVEIKVSEISKILYSPPAENSHVRIKKCSCFSPLQLLWWASLLYGARGQLTDPFPAQFELSSLDGTNGFIINGEAAGDFSGVSVSPAGDVNGDGLADLVIGAHLAAPSGKSSTGKSYVLYGSRDIASGGVFELSSLNGTNGFILNGESGGDLFGSSVSSAGDVNGDGIDDLVIGANAATPLGRSLAGKSYVVFGRRSIVSGGVIELSSLDGTNGFILYGEATDDMSGFSVSSTGDVNGDGIEDLLIGAHFASPLGIMRAGKSYVVYGSRSIVSGGVFELSSLNGSNGFILIGQNTYDRSGYSVSSSGDVNGDGIADLVIGAYYATPLGRSSAGKSYLIYGSRRIVSGGVIELSSLNGTNGFILNGEELGDFSGGSVSSAGDVNGDGLADLMIGARLADPSGIISAGKSYVVYGRRSIVSGGVFELSSLNGTNGFILNGEARRELSGHSVSSAGDVNGDGLADLVIGAHVADPLGRLSAGKSYVVFGSRRIVSGGVIELSSLDGTNGFILNGEAAGDQSGRSVSSTGDLNGDGIDDLVIGAHRASPSARMNAGKSYVIFGRSLTKTSTHGIELTKTTTKSTSQTSFATNQQTTATAQDLTSFKPSLINTQALPTTLLLRTMTPKSSKASDASNRLIMMRTTFQATKTENIHSIIATSTLQQFDQTAIIAMSVGAGILGLGCSILGGCLFITKKKSLQNEKPHNENKADPKYAKAPSIDDEKQDGSSQNSSYGNFSNILNDEDYTVGPIELD